MIKSNKRQFPSTLYTVYEESSRFPFSFSQAWQDIFVLVALNGLRNGTYLEIGAGDARSINNTYLLEKFFGWRGVSVDIDPRSIWSYRLFRQNPCLHRDACETDYQEIFRRLPTAHSVDYLQLDIEPSTNTLRALRKVLSDGVKAKVITFETDFYDASVSQHESDRVRFESREILRNFGYQLVAADVGSTSIANPFEDWYVDPSQVDVSRLEHLIALGQRARSAEELLFQGPHKIVSEFYDGQGLGNQLWAYAVTRLAAERQDFCFGFAGVERFKGHSFINLDFGFKVEGGRSLEGCPPLRLPRGIANYHSEVRVTDVDTRLDVSPIDPALWTLPPGTKIDGNFQSYQYLINNESLVRSWINIDPEIELLNKPDSGTCLIHVRGGDFKGLKFASLGANYYEPAINYIKENFGVIRFRAITDDPSFARTILPNEVEISTIHLERDHLQARHHVGSNVGQDFAELRQARYLIISNSSFAWWAAFLNTSCEIAVAPKYWAAFNSDNKIWSTSEIITPGFTYIDANGSRFSSDDCFRELRAESQIRAQYRSLNSTATATLAQHLRGQLTHLIYLSTFWIVKIKKKLLSEGTN